jgi:hypothetical protein
VYAVLQTNPPRLYSNLQYVQRWRNPLSLKSEAGCYFTHLQAAASFLDNLASEQSQRREGGGASPLAPLPPANAEADEDADEDDAASVAASSGAAAAAAEGSAKGSARPGSLCLTRDDIEQMRSVSYAHATSDWQQQIETLWQQQARTTVSK